MKLRVRSWILPPRSDGGQCARKPTAPPTAKVRKRNNNSANLHREQERKMASDKPTLYSERQVALIRESGRIVAQCLKMIGEMIRPGVTTREIDRAVFDKLKKAGATSPFFGYQFPGKVPFPA